MQGGAVGIFAKAGVRPTAAMVVFVWTLSGPAFAAPSCETSDDFKVETWNLQASALVSPMASADASRAAVSTKSQPVSPPALGDTSRLIVGTADFLATRANDEVRFWIKDELLARVCGDKDRPQKLKDYFPSLCSLYASY